MDEHGMAVRTGRVISAGEPGGYGVQELTVDIDGSTAKAVNYPTLTGTAAVGDTVILNTTAVELGLGTGGSHFVIHITGNATQGTHGPGHIMKLRYTPMQLRCLSMEEEDSPWHEALGEADSISGMPVVVAGLHSMVPVIAAGIRSKVPEARIIYIMTDGASLPAAFSRSVPQMRELGLIDACITEGHSFGGDFEAVNVWSALLAARNCLAATHAIVAMGPGIVGTGTRFGFTGMEQAEVLNAVHCLGGRPISALRMSFADMRERHRGISHHSVTVLGKGTLVRALVGVPALDGERSGILREQVKAAGLESKHDFTWDIPSDSPVDACVGMGIKLSTMGRGVDREREFFLSAAAAGILAGNH